MFDSLEDDVPVENPPRIEKSGDDNIPCRLCIPLSLTSVIRTVLTISLEGSKKKRPNKFKPLGFNFNLYKSNHVAYLCTPDAEFEGVPTGDEISMNDIPSRIRSLIWKTLKKASYFLEESIKQSSDTKAHVDIMLASLRPLISTSSFDDAGSSFEPDEQTSVHSVEHEDDVEINDETQREYAVDSSANSDV